ncbi:hypothetical protein MY04_3533 [Flammeovirga sp. MY04]|uniref:hypothetical protein n=1 Tax=Flammeovirga sp. MY04 TaxID=1191459 RepID=UPI0013053A4C|nr:hypothetical protein [Flammeovirga sp. MY04]ANQ50884.2 hypothetical protein MY04_3533 [Flammeovirga sp. MY04]
MSRIFYVLIVSFLMLCSCQKVNKTSYPKELITEWICMEEADSVCTFTNNTDKLTPKRGGRTHYDIKENGDVFEIITGSNDMPIKEKGVWSFNSKEQLLTFVIKDVETTYKVQSLTNDKLDLKLVK